MIPSNEPTPENIQRLRDYLTTCWYQGWWSEVENVKAWFREHAPPTRQIVSFTPQRDGGHICVMRETWE